LERVIFEDGEGFIKIGSQLFYQSGLKEITLKRVTVIPDWAFSHCAIETITIPKDVTRIGDFAFNGTTLRQVIFEGDKLETVGNRAFASCIIREISFPESARIAPDAFRYSLLLENIDITDEQITQIARELHEAYIGPADNFTVNITRDAKYGGTKFEGEYLANTETINLRFEYFSIYVLDALIHEFFHHYQYVLMEGVGTEDFNSVPVYVNRYSHYSVPVENPYIIVANKQIPYGDSGLTYSYESIVSSCISFGRPYVLIDENMLDLWRQPYIDYDETLNNWDEYWNQMFEADARGFSSWFTGVWG